MVFFYILIPCSLQLDNIKRSSDHTDQAAEAAREELMEARMRIETLGYQLSGLQKQVHHAEVFYKCFFL